MEIPNLWPPELFANIDRDSPVSVLRMQAAYLRDHTRGLVLGRVHSRTRGAVGDVAHSLDLVVPVIEDYAYTLLTVEHGVDPYPATVLVEDGMDVAFMAENVGALEEHLRDVFGRERTRRVVATLCAQADEPEVT